MSTWLLHFSMYNLYSVRTLKIAMIYSLLSNACLLEMKRVEHPFYCIVNWYFPVMRI